MKTHRLIERSLYVAIVILSLIALALVLASPAEFLNNKVIYGGF